MSTHLSLHYHVVFSTKHRRDSIRATWRPRLHAYLGGAIREAGGVPECIGGTADHIHIMMELKATHRLSDVLRNVKGGSSLWIHEELGEAGFGWQEGYGAFSLSADHRTRLRGYIENQEQHHRSRRYEDEYLSFLKRNGVVFDERYVWG
jgi:REP element-mobilizing transposase RayT